jgi:hypothetical protein
MVEPLLFCGDLVDGESSAGKNFSGRILCSGALSVSKRFAAGMMRVTDCVMLECRVELAFVVGASVIPHPDKVYNLLNIYFLALLQLLGRPAIDFVRNCGFYYYLLYSFDMRILPVFCFRNRWRKEEKMLISYMIMVEVYLVLLMVFPGELVWKSLINSLFWI